MTNIPIKRLREGAVFPSYATASAAGADLYACIDEPVTIRHGMTEMIPLGFSMAIPQGWVGLIFARSGLASKRDLAPANKVGVVDADYRGSGSSPSTTTGGASRWSTPGSASPSW